MTPDEFTFISTLIKQRSGLVLTEDKAYLLDSRLMPVARQHDIAGLSDLISQIRMRKDEALIKEVVEALTTNESHFFRDTHPFEVLRDGIMPELMPNRPGKSLRIWCAAASSGQEPASIVMTLNEMGAALAGWRYELVGTDISEDILAKAKKGLYSQFEVQRGMPIQLLLKYFNKVDENWAFKPEFLGKITYKYANLLDNQSMLGKFDIVFCRNVLIYFDRETKAKVLEMIHGMMPDDGKLLLGGAETVVGITDKFKSVPGKRGLYQKN